MEAEGYLLISPDGNAYIKIGKKKNHHSLRVGAESFEISDVEWGKTPK